MQDIEHRNENKFSAATLRRQRRVGEGEQERQNHSGEHAQGRPRRIARKVRGVERDGRRLQLGQGLHQSAASIGQKNDRAEDQQECEQVPPGWDECAFLTEMGGELDVMSRASGLRLD